MMKQRLLGMLGFAMRAGKLVIGTELVCRALPRKDKGRLYLVVTACDASDASKKKIGTKCEFYGVKNVEIAMTADELGAHLGKTYTPVCVGICDEGFAREIELAAGEP